MASTRIVKLPVVTEIVFVEKLLLDSKAKLRKLYLGGIVTKPNPTNLSNTIPLAINHELMEVGVTPAQRNLQSVVESGDCAVTAN